MAELDLTAAVDAAACAIERELNSGAVDAMATDSDEALARAAVEAAAPLIVQAVEACALALGEAEGTAGITMTPSKAAQLRALHGVLREVAVERGRQDEKWGEQNHPDGTGQYAEITQADAAQIACQSAAEGGYLDWLHIAREEVFEAFAEADPSRLRVELIQAAAVFVAWAQAIDRRAVTDA